VRAIADPGDEIVYVSPPWFFYESLIVAQGATAVRVPLDPAGFDLDLAAIAAAITPRTRAIIVNSPHNPTGAHLSREALDALVAVAADAGAVLFSDEVYRYLELDLADRLPGAAELADHVVSLGVMSKTFALPGLRIGWVATRDEALLARLAELKDYTTICNPAPSEILSLVALRNLDAVVARSRGIVESNLERLDGFFERFEASFEWVRPRAGSIGFPRLLADVPVERFAAELIEAEGVVLLPGTAYGHDGNHFRLGLGRRNLPEALERLERFAAWRIS
jgi:aspartate/methionine/tyrosine aminotransferase